MKGSVAAVLLGLALLAALTPVYWLATISLKQTVDQFAVPPIWVSFTPTLDVPCDATGTDATNLSGTVVLPAAQALAQAFDLSSIR